MVINQLYPEFGSSVKFELMLKNEQQNNERDIKVPLKDKGD